MALFCVVPLRILLVLVNLSVVLGFDAGCCGTPEGCCCCLKFFVAVVVVPSPSVVLLRKAAAAVG